MKDEHESAGYRSMLQKLRSWPSRSLAVGFVDLGLPRSSISKIIGRWLIPQKSPQQPRPDTKSCPIPAKPFVSDPGSGLPALSKTPPAPAENRPFLNLQNLTSHLNKHQQLPSPLTQTETFHPPRSLTFLHTSAPLLIPASVVSGGDGNVTVMQSSSTESPPPCSVVVWASAWAPAPARPALGAAVRGDNIPRCIPSTNAHDVLGLAQSRGPTPRASDCPQTAPRTDSARDTHRPSALLQSHSSSGIR